MALPLLCAAAVFLPATVWAEAPLPDGPLFEPDLNWLAAISPVAEPPGGAPAPPLVLSDAGGPHDQSETDVPSPGLQFSVDPGDGQVFLGWQFEF
jgi:hypothetical protein